MAHPHSHIRIVPTHPQIISAIFVRILPLRRYASPILNLILTSTLNLIVILAISFTVMGHDSKNKL